MLTLDGLLIRGASYLERFALETSLYLPVKRFLEDQGFTVKGEVGGCDLVALKDGLGQESKALVLANLVSVA